MKIKSLITIISLLLPLKWALHPAHVILRDLHAKKIYYEMYTGTGFYRYYWAKPLRKKR